MRDTMKNIARAPRIIRCFSATEGATGLTYLGLRDLDTVEGGGAERARGARLGRGDAGREDSDGGDDGSHGCVCWSVSRCEAIIASFRLPWRFFGGTELEAADPSVQSVHGGIP